MHSLRQRRISSGSSSVSSSSVVAARSLTLQLQDIRVKQRRGTASQWQAFRIWHPRLHAASRNLEEQIETTSIAQLLTTLRYRLKLALSSQHYPWLKSRSKYTHFTKATVKRDWCPGGWKGPCRVGLLLRHTVVKCLFHAFSMPPPRPPQVCHLAVPCLWAPQHRVSGQERCSLYPFTKPCRWNPFKKVCEKAFDVHGSETALSFQTWEKFLVFFPLRWKW